MISTDRGEKVRTDNDNRITYAHILYDFYFKNLPEIGAVLRLNCNVSL